MTVSYGFPLSALRDHEPREQGEEVREGRRRDDVDASNLSSPLGVAYRILTTCFLQGVGTNNRSRRMGTHRKISGVGHFRRRLLSPT